MSHTYGFTNPENSSLARAAGTSSRAPGPGAANPELAARTAAREDFPGLRGKPGPDAALVRREYALDLLRHAGGSRMRARSHHRQRVRGDAERVEPGRGIRAGAQEAGGDLSGVGGNNLAPDLDPVGRRVVQQR